MKKYSAADMIDRARIVCKYEPEFNYNPENGMLQIWDYSEEHGESFHREDYCKASQVDLDELFKLIHEEHFLYVTSLHEAYYYVPTDLSEIFGDARATDIKNNLSKAFISEVYDNAVDIVVPTSEGDVVFSFDCYYLDGDDERPLAGEIYFDTDARVNTVHFPLPSQYDCGLPGVVFSEEEMSVIQNLLDNYPFKKGHFLPAEERDEI